MILGDSIKEHEEAMVQLRRHMKEMESQMLALTENAQMLKQLVLCQHCCKRLRNVILLPCMHLLFCSKCAKELKRKHKKESADNEKEKEKEKEKGRTKAGGGGGGGGTREENGNGTVAAAAATRKKLTVKSRFRCPKCSTEVRGKMKCEMGC
jgi:hypothetical protein